MAPSSMSWTRQTQGFRIFLHWTGLVRVRRVTFQLGLRSEARKYCVMRNCCLWLKMSESAWIHWQNLMCVFLELLALVAAVRALRARLRAALLRLTFGSFAQRWPQAAIH